MSSNVTLHPDASVASHGEAVVSPFVVRCHLCDRLVDLMECETMHPVLPNSPARLPDYNRTLWKCTHCGGWN